MTFRPVKADKYSIINAFMVAACIFVNAMLAFFAHSFSLPLYLDCTGTVFAAFLGGSMPGIIVAVVTNFVCTPFNEYSMFFSVLNILVALVAGHFSTHELNKKRIYYLWFILAIAFIGGVLGTPFQWIIMGGPQFDDIADTAMLLAGHPGFWYVLYSVLLNFILNIVDKTISVGIAVLVLKCFPPKLIKALRDNTWNQKPLTEKEKKIIKESTGKGFHSMRFRISFMLTIASLAMTAVVVWISNSQNYRVMADHYIAIANSAGEYTAEIVDGDRIDEYLSKGYDAPGYKETENRLYEIRDHFPGVRFLSVIKIENDGGHYAFDLDSGSDEGYDPGFVQEFNPAFADKMNTLFEGGKIDPIKTRTEYGDAITVYTPIPDSLGKTAAYAVVDVSTGYLAEFEKDFLFKIAMIFSGFFVMILGLGLWTTGRYLVYPIGSMALEAENFVKGIGDQDKLDDNIKQMRKLDIKTDDEVEKLYKAICEMGSGIADQVRELRYYSEATSRMQNGLIITMADMVENRDSDTGAHIQKTAAYVKIILEGLKRSGYYAEKLTPRYMAEVEMSAPLHDVGKINIPDAVLNKPGKLTEEEFEIMKTHTTHGKRIMEQAISTVSGENYLKEARNMAAYHHERWDGKGYPEGLHGQVIPLSARVMAVADVFDALTSPRIYKPPFPIEKALEIIGDGSGTAFDPKVVEVFMDSLPEVKLVLKKYQES
ncbi:MAG: HD domain-containing protein [Lachnospiraceae bacterium]|nr:HD domain-containing protein [Lachnospiraceae bacterium]